MNGWMGRILQVDLTRSKITHIPIELYAEKYLGGRGIASRLYWESVSPETSAFDPENRLIFMAGPLVGTGAQGATRMSVVGKSPMAYPEGYCYGNIGGFFGAELPDYDLRACGKGSGGFFKLDGLAGVLRGRRFKADLDIEIGDADYIA